MKNFYYASLILAAVPINIIAGLFVWSWDHICEKLRTVLSDAQDAVW